MGACASCCCMECFMDSYLHIHVRNISKANFKGDINISGTSDICVKIKWQSYQQDTEIHKGEKGSIVFDEPLILENAAPNAEEKLRIEVWDVDTASADDLLAYAEVVMPEQYGDNWAEKIVPLKDPGSGADCGEISIDQIHFIKQKVRRYMGPCKCLCCCLNTGTNAN